MTGTETETLYSVKDSFGDSINLITHSSYKKAVAITLTGTSVALNEEKVDELITALQYWKATHG